MPVRVLLVCAAAMLSCPRAHGEAWTEFRTPHFVLLSAANERTTLQWATELELFCAELAQHSQQDRHRPPLTVLLFANNAGIAPFRPSSGPRIADYPAYFGASTSGAFFLLTPRADIAATRELAYHAAFHWISGADYRREIPAWYVEGMAEVFATFKLSRSEIEFGAPLDRHNALLSADSFMSVRDLFNMSRERAKADDYLRNTAFHAESWLLVHYLFFDQPSLSSAPSRYYALRARNMPEAQAFQQAFGMNMADMDKLLATLSRRLAFTAKRRKVDVAAAERAIQPVPFAPADLDRAMGQAFLGMGRPAEAEIHLKRAFAARPDDGATLLSFAELAATRKDVGDARAWCDQAIARDPGCAAAYMLRALALLAAKTGDGRQVPDPLDARTAADDLIRALKLAPHWTVLVPILANLLPVAQPTREEDYALMEKAAATWPPSDAVLAALAALDERAGHVEKARDEYQRVLALDPPPGEPIRRYVAGRLSQLNAAGSGGP